MSTEKLPHTRRPPASAAEAAKRLAAIVEAAEQAAARVIDEAEEQAHRRLEQAEAQADRLVAERLRALADELDASAPEGRRLRPLEPVEDDPQPAVFAAGQRRSGSAGARLLAIQMAVSGAARGEIEGRLRNGFEIEDAGAILDAILGPEE